MKQLTKYLTKLRAIRPAKADLKAAGMMAGVQLLVYFIFSVNARALAQGRTFWTFSSDLVYAAVSYYVIKNVAKNESRWGQVGYVLGGAWGSVLAILLTKYIFGQ